MGGNFLTAPRSSLGYLVGWMKSSLLVARFQTIVVANSIIEAWYCCWCLRNWCSYALRTGHKLLDASDARDRQYLIYRKTYNTIINTLKASTINVQFNISFTSFNGSITVNTLVGNIKFYIIKANTPFLLYFTDMDILKVYYNNLKNVLVTLIKSVLVAY